MQVLVALWKRHSTLGEIAAAVAVAAIAGKFLDRALRAEKESASSSGPVKLCCRVKKTRLLAEIELQQ